jgi:hypothetical protein
MRTKEQILAQIKTIQKLVTLFPEKRNDSRESIMSLAWVLGFDRIAADVFTLDFTKQLDMKEANKKK